MEHFADGIIIWTQPSGTITRIESNGYICDEVHHWGFSRDAAGNRLSSSKDAEGSLVIQNANGSCTILKSDFTRIVFSEDGRRQVLTPLDSLLARYPNGAETYQLSSGALVTFDLAGCNYPTQRIEDGTLSVDFST